MSYCVNLLGNMTHYKNNARIIIISDFLFAFFFVLLMMFYFGFCLPGIYLGKVRFLSAFCVLFVLKRRSLFIPVCDTTLSSHIKYVTLDTKQAYVKYRSKQTICFIDGNFVPERVTENMGHFLINCAFRSICFRKILLCCGVQSGG
jgi:hypothetical protein